MGKWDHLYKATNNPYWPTCRNCGVSVHIDYTDSHVENACKKI
jgi:hypothetical protein